MTQASPADLSAEMPLDEVLSRLAVPTPMVGADGVIDMTNRNKAPFRFRLGDGDANVFTAPAKLGFGKIERLTGMLAALESSKGNLTATLKAAADCMALMVGGTEGGRLRERLYDEDDPVDLQTEVMPTLYLLLEKFGLRPTTPSSSLPTGSTEQPTATRNDGTSSTDGPSPQPEVTAI